MKCVNCGYESKDSEFHGFGGCPACCADENGIVDRNSIPIIFHVEKDITEKETFIDEE
jgi:hypothetical protein